MNRSIFEMDLNTILSRVGADGTITDAVRQDMRRQFMALLDGRKELSEKERAEAIEKFEGDITHYKNVFEISLKNTVDSLEKTGTDLEHLDGACVAVAMHLGRTKSGNAHIFELGEAYNAIRIAQVSVGKALAMVRRTAICCFPGALVAEEGEETCEEATPATIKKVVFS